MKISFIGCGNMGGAILHGLLQKQMCTVSNITVSDKNEQTLAAYQQMGIQTTPDNVACANAGEIVVLAVKPNIYPAVLRELKDAGATDRVFVSIAAGKSTQEIKEILGQDAKVIRTMPNTPALVGEGMTVIAKPDEAVSEAEFAQVQSIFSAFGKVAILPESQLGSCIAVSSSSPAYVFAFIEAMADGAVRDGIPRAVAYELAAQAVLGSAKMVLETGKHPGELKDMVCSPGGTTIAAMDSLERDGFRGTVMKAMDACTKKANAL